MEFSQAQQKVIDAIPTVAIYESHGYNLKVESIETESLHNGYAAFVIVKVNMEKGNLLTQYTHYFVVGRRGGISLYRKHTFGFDSEYKNFSKRFWRRYYEAQNKKVYI